MSITLTVLKNIPNYLDSQKDIKINKYNYNYIYLFLRTFPNLIENVKIINYVNNTFIDYVITLKDNIKNSDFLKLITILKSSILFKYKYLNDFTCVDNLNILNKNIRFSLIYILQNINKTTKLILFKNINKLESTPSLTSLYKSSEWAEREIFDLFGIFFLNHPDLRKILTDRKSVV